jgi:hypothetical protein
MKALIDMDMPAHEIGHIQEEVGTDPATGDPIKQSIPWDQMVSLAKGMIIKILTGCQAGGFVGWITRGENFRHELATIKPYKGHREDQERHLVDYVKDFYADNYEAVVCTEYEADDAMSMMQWDDYADLSNKYDGNEHKISRHAHTVICSRDKDLDTVPGWHYQWPLKDKPETWPYYLTIIEATRNFYKQLLMGDTADHIHGLYRVGEKSAWVKQLEDMETEQEMYDHVLVKYTNYFCSYALQFLRENARLLWMWRRPNDDWLPPDERDDDWYLTTTRY